MGDQLHSPHHSLSTHSGNGKLRGGGVQAARGPTRLGHLARRLDRRLGLVAILCMACLLSALAIHGLSHDRARSVLVELIGAVEGQVISLEQHEIGMLIANSTENPSSTTAHQPEEETTTAEEQFGGEGGGPNSTNSSGGGAGWNRTTPAEGGEEEETEAEQTTPAGGTPKMGPGVWVLRRRTEQLAELDQFRQRFVDTDGIIWTLVVLNLLGLVLLVPSTCLFWARTTSSPPAAATSTRPSGHSSSSDSCTLAYRVFLALLALLFLGQLILLVFLLNNVAHFPSIVDRLFGTYLLDIPLEKRYELYEPIEEQFGCKVKVEHELLEKYGLQERCVPKLKDRLLSPSLVCLLLFVALFPFPFAVFTYLWPVKIKKIPSVEKVRRNVERTVKRAKEGEKKKNGEEQRSGDEAGGSESQREKHIVMGMGHGQGQGASQNSTE